MFLWLFLLFLPTIESLCLTSQGCSDLSLQQSSPPSYLNESSCLKVEDTRISVQQVVSVLNTHNNCPLVPDNLKASLFLNNLSIHSEGEQKLLAVNWRFESDVSSIEYLLRIAKISDTSEYCKHYIIIQQHSVPTKSFVDNCVLVLEESSSYTVNITNPVNRRYKTYTVFSPQNGLKKIGVSSSASEWRTILAVNADDRHLEVKFIPNTEHTYKIEAKSRRGSQVQLENTQLLTIQPNQSEAIFNTSGDTRFSITIKYCTELDSCDQIQTTYYFEPNFNIMDKSTSTSDDPSISVADVEDGITLRKEHIIIIATTGAALVVVAIGVAIFILCYRRRNQHASVEDYHMSHLQHGDGFTSSFLLDEEDKESPPTVLILYSYDHQAHLSAVQSLALLLQNALSCVVLTDFWAGQEISERGVGFWLEQILQTVDFVIVVCSSGVRFKSCTSRNHNLYQDTEDPYLIAMKLLQGSATVAKESQQHIVIYFNYCSEWDIPASLEDWPRYKLPEHSENFMSLFDDDKKSIVHEDCKTCCMESLREKTVEADRYISENPNWFHLHIEPEEANTSPEPHNVQVKGSGGSLSRHKFKTISDLSVQELNKQVVTVEYNISCNDLADSDYESGPSTKRSAPTLSKLTKSNGNFHENDTSFSYLDSSPSSSMEDLEKDIKFMLNPTIKQKYHSTPGYMMNLGSSPLPLSISNVSNTDSLLPLPECVEQPDTVTTPDSTDNQTPDVTFTVISDDSSQLDC